MYVIRALSLTALSNLNLFLQVLRIENATFLMFTVLTGSFIILMSEINDAQGVLHPGHLLLKIQTWILGTVSSAVHTRDS